MLEPLKIKVAEANRKLREGEKLDPGFISAIDRASGLIVVPPVASETFTYETMLVIDSIGNILEGEGEIPPDALMHAEVYNEFTETAAIAQTFTPYATAFAQAKRDIPFYGVCHGSSFCGDVPCVRLPEITEYTDDFERMIGRTVVEEMGGSVLGEMPACLLEAFGVLAFGKTPTEALRHAMETERVARLAYLTENLTTSVSPADPNVLEHVFYRLKRDK